MSRITSTAEFSSRPVESAASPDNFHSFVCLIIPVTSKLEPRYQTRPALITTETKKEPTFSPEPLDSLRDFSSRILRKFPIGGLKLFEDDLQREVWQRSVVKSELVEASW